jgi:hypothetical protein
MLTTVGIIALVLLVLAMIKMLVLLISPKFYLGYVKKIFKNKVVFQIGCLVLAAIVLFFLLKELTIIQIFASAAFVSLLVGIGVSDFGERIVSVYRKHLRNKTLWKSYWLYIVLWLALMVWVFLELFFPSVI